MAYNCRGIDNQLLTGKIDLCPTLEQVSVNDTERVPGPDRCSLPATSVDIVALIGILRCLRGSLSEP